MRRFVVIGSVAVVAAVAAGAVVHAASGGASQRMNRQTLAWTSSGTSTSSDSWADVPGLDVETSCPLKPVASAILTVQTKAGSAPARFRVVRRSITVVNDKPHPLRPGAMTISTPAHDPGLATLLFAKRRLVDGHGEDYSVQWRSPSNRRVTLTKAVLKVDWAAASGNCL